MKKVPTTVVALVGPDAGDAVDGLRDAANVRTVVPEREDPHLDRVTRCQ
jgi:hypothetical protein